MPAGIVIPPHAFRGDELTEAAWEQARALPAIVGCGDATQRLKTGDRVRVNGGLGSVEVLE